MKTFLTRGVALLLAVLMVFTACGCSGDKHERGDDVFQPMEGEEPVDLQGYEFTVLCHGGADNWNQEVSGTPYADAWIQLVDEVEYLYNCDITATAVGWQDMFNVVQPEIAAGGKSADIIISPEHAYGAFLGANLMVDLNELDVNWDNEWWNQSIRKTTTYNNKSYVGGGSFIFDTRATWLCYVNKAIWDQHGFEDPYELVDSGKWTYDKFREYAIAAAKDNDGSGKLDSSEDVYGVIAANGDFCDAWFQAMGGHFFKADEEDGKVVLACNTTRTYEIVEKMYNMIQKDNVYGFLGLGEVEHVQQFTGGGALFYCYTVGKDGLQDMEDDWFVLPMPKFDEKQEDYLSGVDHNAAVFGVTNTNEDLREVSILLEAIGRHAMILEQIFWPDYKDTYWRDPESERIVSEYVVGHGQHDLALIMANCGAAFQAPRSRLFSTVFAQAGPDFSSYIDTVEEAIEMEIQDFFEYEAETEAETEA
ncbi:MAG: carbohydrate ABC transporter substrate-binding protein [Ruminococcaceae bacterium]|nr:carbohydrate ABC transporter substrate-binding protein [Oscillospiraceae bacterium]